MQKSKHEVPQCRALQIATCPEDLKKCNNRKEYQKIILSIIMRLFGAFVSEPISDQFSMLVEISLVSVDRDLPLQ